MLERGAPDDPAEIQPQLWAGASGHRAFDVGANTGQSVERLLGAGFSQVYAFEPADESFDLLERRFVYDDRVHCMDYALADHLGTLETAVMERPIASGQLVSVAADHAGRADPSLQTWGALLGHRAVPCTTLDEVAKAMGHPDFVKIDTEGHELLILKGSSRTIRQGTRFLIEFHDDTLHDSCAALLQEAGYQVQTIRHPAYPPGSYMHTRHGWIKASREN